MNPIMLLKPLYLVTAIHAAALVSTLICALRLGIKHSEIIADIILILRSFRGFCAIFVLNFFCKDVIKPQLSIKWFIKFTVFVIELYPAFPVISGIIKLLIALTTSEAMIVFSSLTLIHMIYVLLIFHYDFIRWKKVQKYFRSIFAKMIRNIVSVVLEFALGDEDLLSVILERDLNILYESTSGSDSADQTYSSDSDLAKALDLSDWEKEFTAETDNHKCNACSINHKLFIENCEKLCKNPSPKVYY